MSLDAADPRAPYQQIANAIRSEIQAGTLAAGARLPSVADLASKYGVAKMTAQRALRELSEEGLVVSWQGRGTFVRERGTGGDAGAGNAEPFEAIMQRLDAMYDELQRLEGRVSQLEADRQAQR